jgi:hypothetical protein
LRSAAASGTHPFVIGVAFAKGHVPSTFTLDIAQYQVTVKRNWSDGSVKHAIVSGRAPLTQNITKTVSVTIGGSPPAGTALTAASIQAAAPSASVSCGAFGTVNLSSLLASPFRTWISGPEMVECHYRADVGGGTLLSAWFYVRLFADGRMWVRAIVENGYLDNGSGGSAPNADRSYAANVTIGGSSVFSGALTHYRNTRWTAESWIGGDPQITGVHDVEYLTDARLVPHYGWRTPTDQGLNNWFNSGPWTPFTASYAPMIAGDIFGNMGGTGYGPFIGLLPLWNALYVTSGDPRALRSTLINASAVNHRPIVWRSKSTNLVPRPSDFPTWSTRGPGGAGDDFLPAGSNNWDQPHHPGEGYLAYLLTGDYWYLETLAMGASANYLYMSSTRGSGVNRLMRHTQVRGTAWMVRTVGCYAAIAPNGDAVASDYRTWLATGGYNYFANVGPNASGASPLGYVLTIGAPNGPLTIPPWMQHFWIAVNGFVWDIEPGFASTANHLAVRDFMYRAIVGILGGNGSGNYCYTEASMYDGLVISPNNYAPGGTDIGMIITANGFSSSWGEVWTNTHGSSNTSCGTTGLGGGSGGAPTNAATGYWGNALPAIAYAVDHGAPGARDAWNRLTAASNWNVINDSGFDNTPVWGVKPRS